MTITGELLQLIIVVGIVIASHYRLEVKFMERMHENELDIKWASDKIDSIEKDIAKLEKKTL